MACPTGKIHVESKDPRINYNLLPGEKLLTCPYNISHALLPLKFPTHVMKCRRAHVKSRAEQGKEPLFSICKYDRSHHVRNEELAYHHSDCAAKLKAKDDFESWDYHDDCTEDIETQKISLRVSYNTSDYGRELEKIDVVLQKPPEVDPAILAEIGEDWDNEPQYHEAFDPDMQVMKCRKAGYDIIQVHKVVGLTKTEKKAFYKSDAELMKELKKEGDEQAKVKGNVGGISSLSTVTSCSDDISSVFSLGM